MGIVIIAALHGLMFLPVLLSYKGIVTKILIIFQLIKFARVSFVFFPIITTMSVNIFHTFYYFTGKMVAVNKTIFLITIYHLVTKTIYLIN